MLRRLAYKLCGVMAVCLVFGTGCASSEEQTSDSAVLEAAGVTDEVKEMTRSEVETKKAEEGEKSAAEEAGEPENEADTKDAEDVASADNSDAVASDDPALDESASDTEATDTETSDEEAEETSDTTDMTWLSDWKSDHPKVKGLYITGPIAGSSSMDSIIELIDDTDLNAVVIDLKNDDGEITITTGDNRGYISDIGALMEKLDEHDIYTIARIVCFKDPVFAEGSPAQALLKADGTPIVDGHGIAWVNPCDKEVWDHIASAAELAGEVGFDEVQFDYVRFPVGSDADAAVYGIELNEDTKKQTITEFFEYMTERLHESRIVVGADLFGTIIRSDVDAKNVGQSFPDIITMIDVVSPMIYPSHYGPGSFGLDVPDANPHDTIYAALTQTKEIEEASEKEVTAVVRPWLQSFTATWVDGHISYEKKEIDAQIKAVYDAGYDEWILWNASNKYENYR